jgi:hypothetical protein
MANHISVAAALCNCGKTDRGEDDEPCPCGFLFFVFFLVSFGGMLARRVDPAHEHTQ